SDLALVCAKSPRRGRRRRRIRTPTVARTLGAVARFADHQHGLSLARGVVFARSSDRVHHGDLSPDGLAIRTLSTVYAGISARCDPGGDRRVADVAPTCAAPRTHACF